MNSTIGPIALRQDEGEPLWFLGVLATIKAAGEATGGRLSSIWAPEARDRRCTCIGARTSGSTSSRAS